jgi:hypothetical protein
MLYLRYLRELLAEQDDPRAALVLEDLPEHTEHRHPDWMLHAYLLDRLREVGTFTSPVTAQPGYELGLVYPVEHWLAWRYHGGAHSGHDEPQFSGSVDKAEFLEACESIVAELDTSQGLDRATRWYVDRVRAQLRDHESRPASPRPSETLHHAELRRAALLADKRDQLARLEAAPTFPGYEHAGSRS